MKKLSSNQPCPACKKTMELQEVYCSECDITVRGHFEQNEFAHLDQEELHFLRIFILSEGRVRDMEAALGLSYPTIRNRLSDLKNKIETVIELTNLDGEGEKTPATSTEVSSDDVMAVLKNLEEGKLNFAEASKKIKEKKMRKKV